MSRHTICSALMLTLVAGLLFVQESGQASSASSTAGGWKWRPLLDKDRRRCFLADYSGGMRFKLKRKKVDGEKQRGIEMKSRQNSGFGYVNTGCRLGLDWKINATFNYPKDKGLQDGRTYAGLEIDTPYVDVGLNPTRFIFVGATWHGDGISTFVNDSGATVGTQASYPGSESIDIEIRYMADVEFTISTRATGTLPWDLLYNGDSSLPLEGEAGLGFGVNNIDKGGLVFLCGLEMEGEIFTGLKKAYLDDLQKALVLMELAIKALYLFDKSFLLADAMALIDEFIADLQADYILGEIDIDFDATMKALRKAYRNLYRAEERLEPGGEDDPDKVPVWGDWEFERVKKAIAKTKKAMELIKKMRVTY